MDETLRDILLAFYTLGYQRGVFNASGTLLEDDAVIPKEVEREFDRALLRHPNLTNRLAHVKLARTE